MEELLELKTLLQQGNIAAALVLVEELEEMSKSDKLNKVYSYGIILLLPLIKKTAEARTTKSWETSIFKAVRQIQRVNQRHKTGGTYLTTGEIAETLRDACAAALRNAALEAFEGIYEAQQLADRLSQEEIMQAALSLIYAA
ncbi:MAG: DUF29 domain-containing protein [Leptolyngbyaceae cyanobacterium SM1_1_3]|nr:DUF29 domain-containing protein [Leptolyngbyaceae cyanobacterium SM1_1_3]NJN02786.1 DUF29 domain-containing protein [Leptolyngbyaceae cyanobacterium RM1_1_2]NJO11363.1 DUF29 domain-containing protein [Leptolyngbyaceae cyanobacterium SL_1_1]